MNAHLGECQRREARDDVEQFFVNVSISPAKPFAAAEKDQHAARDEPD